MRRDVLRAVLWVFLETVAKNLLAFSVTVALARLLSPPEFGVVAMLSLFVGIAATLAEGGMGAALLQAKDPSQADISTLFWTQLAMAVVLGSLLAALGPALASWFGQDVLAPLAIAYAVNLVIAAPASLHAVLFMKSLQFRTPTLIALGAQTIAGVAAVAAALHGAGPWAIVVQAVSGSVVTTFLLWRTSPWRPSAEFRLETLRQLAGFGLFSVGTGIMAEIELRVGSMAIGLASGSAGTGQYQRASSLQLLTARLMSGVVTRVAFPVFAALRDDPRRMVNAIREAVFVNFAVTAFIMWAVALVAEPLVRVLFGAPWSPSAPALQALCVSGGFYPVYAVTSKALRAAGQARLVFLHHVARALGMIGIAFGVAAFGFKALSWAQAAFVLALLPMGAVAIARHCGYDLGKQWEDVQPIVGSGIIMAAAGITVARALPTFGDVAKILLIGLSSMSAYVLSMVLLARHLPMPAARMAWATVASGLRGRQANATE